MPKKITISLDILKTILAGGEYLFEGSKQENTGNENPTQESLLFTLQECESRYVFDSISAGMSIRMKGEASCLCSGGLEKKQQF